jgi:hypothetical protein
VGDFGEQVDQVFSENAWGLSWSPDGEGIFFFAEAGLYFAPSTNFEPILVADGIQLERDDAVTWVMP